MSTGQKYDAAASGANAPQSSEQTVQAQNFIRLYLPVVGSPSTPSRAELVYYALNTEIETVEAQLIRHLNEGYHESAKDSQQHLAGLREIQCSLFTAVCGLGFSLNEEE